MFNKQKDNMKKTNQTSGTHLQGTVETSYDNLVKIFGEPHLKGETGNKTDVEWAFKFDDGTISTIYNWKDGLCYQGDDGDPVETITDWHVGGMHKDALTKVKEKIEPKKAKQLELPLN
jgi:hypothetical protein